MCTREASVGSASKQRCWACGCAASKAGVVGAPFSCSRWVDDSSNWALAGERADSQGCTIVPDATVLFARGAATSSPASAFIATALASVCSDKLLAATCHDVDAGLSPSFAAPGLSNATGSNRSGHFHQWKCGNSGTDCGPVAARCSQYVEGPTEGGERQQTEGVQGFAQRYGHSAPRS